MNVADILKATKTVAEFQKNPEALKKYSPIVVDFFSNILKSANAHHFHKHISLFMHQHEHGPALHLAHVSKDGKVDPIANMYLAVFLEKIRIEGIPDVVKKLVDGNTPPWAYMQRSLFPNSTPQVATFEDKMIEGATEPEPTEPETKLSESVNQDDEWAEILQTLPAEYSRGTCETLNAMLMPIFNQDDRATMLNRLKLHPQWNANTYMETVKSLWYEVDGVMEQMESLLDQAPTHNPTQNEPSVDAMGETTTNSGQAGVLPVNPNE